LGSLALMAGSDSRFTLAGPEARPGASQRGRPHPDRTARSEARGEGLPPAVTDRQLVLPRWKFPLPRPARRLGRGDAGPDPLLVRGVPTPGKARTRAHSGPRRHVCLLLSGTGRGLPEARIPRLGQGGGFERSARPPSTGIGAISPSGSPRSAERSPGGSLELSP